MLQCGTNILMSEIVQNGQFPQAWLPWSDLFNVALLISCAGV